MTALKLTGADHNVWPGVGMRARFAGSLAVTLLLASAALADPPAPDPAPAAKPARSRSSFSLAWTALAYLPNRVFDLCDVVRLRARVGDGWAAGARVTKWGNVFAGSYDALWVGLPGPRGRAALPLPIGYESHAGVDVGPIGMSSRSQAPDYGVGEIGAGVQAYLVGAEAGVDVYELADFFAGFALIDFARDDF
jgi:hypothetical protein